MSTMQFPCPECGRQLELPAESVGRLAQCPACQATFTVSEPPPPSQPSASQPSASQPATDADTSPFTSPLESGMAAPAPMNPYQPVYQAEPATVMDDIGIVPRSIEDVFSPTLSIFGARLGQLILAFILVLVAGFVGVGAWLLSTIVAAEIGGDTLSGLWFLLSAPLAAFFASYLSVGLARNAIAVARNDPSPIQALLPPLDVVLRFLMGGVLMVVIVGGVMAIVAVFFGIMAQLIGDQGVAASLIVIGIFGGSAVSLVGYWALWAWIFIVSDGKSTAIGSIRLAWTVTMHNKLTSVLLVVIATVLSTAGASACYVGLLITQPLTNLMFAVAYLLMTNQIIHDPKVEQSAHTAWDWEK